MGICQSAPPPSQPHTQQIKSQKTHTLNSLNSESIPISSPSDMSSPKIPKKNDSTSIIQRLLIILSEYYKLTKNENNDQPLPLNLHWSDLCFTTYSDTWLINDFNYILDHFNDDEDIEKIHNQLLQKINDKNTLNTNILHRHLICNKSQYKTIKLMSNLYFQAKDINDIIRFKILDKIFTHFMYAHLLGKRLTFTELESIDNAATVTESKENDNQDLDLDLKLQKLNEIIAKKRENWNEFEIKYVENKFVTYLRTKNDENDEEKKENINCKENECFSIGERYYYSSWSYYYENREKLKISSSLIIIGAHYNNLKTEMISSGAVTMDEWMLLETYCRILFASRKCKKLRCDILKSDGHGVDIHYGFKQGDAIDLQHIICIYMYCNVAAIRQRFQTHLHDNKYSNFGRLLRETVEGFGCSVFSDDSENEFYHNISVNGKENDILFDGYLNIKFCEASLMTYCRSIIHLYNYKQQNMTIKLGKSSNFASVNYFECNWISNSDSLDNECLFIGGKYALKLDNIILKNVYNYSHYLAAIHILSSLIVGKSNTFAMNKRLLYAIETLISGKNDNYIQKIFNRFCANICMPIYINLIWILDASNNGYLALKKYITNEDNSWIRFDVLCNLFPNVSKLKIGHSQFMLHDDTFLKFISFFSGPGKGNIKYKLNEITIEDPSEQNISVKTIVHKYHNHFIKIGWKIESNKYYTKIFLNKKIEQNLWDDLF